ncbi:uncharacterized protein KIAA1614-like isoform X2 [Heptranchias perlo]|uniref:uncharacterized protein KIAA1614-like isoform X2 n=1 Tax=Heptranchias perlo TaxID=212740 RepID=UPI0035594094
MAENGPSRDGRLSRSRDRHDNVGAAPRKEKSAKNSAPESEANVYPELSRRQPLEICRRPPDPSASILQTTKGRGPSGRAAGQESERRACRQRCEPRDSIRSGDGRGDSGHEEELSSGLQIHTYLTDRILRREEGQFDGGGNTSGKCTKQGLSRRATETVISEIPRWPNGENPPEKCKAKGWSPPRGFWKVLGREDLASDDGADAFEDEILRSETYNVSGSENPSVDCSNVPGPRGPSEELSKADSRLRCGEWTAGKYSGSRVGHLGGLWRTDSWESVSSNGSLLSLTERVELNRSNLKRTLTPSHLQPGPGVGVESVSQENHAPPACRLQHNILGDIFPGNKWLTQGRGRAQSDSDWDSGISLQESDRGTRAFVSTSQLPLSPRHEQAKRLLERARMKARASPLKADHSILPVERSPLETNGDGISSPKKGPFSGDGGNLSDSSSGESRCGLRKKRSQSPSRVRFEDESTQEAEVRYQLRRKCGLESSVRRGPRGSISKPGLPAYGFPGKERALKADSGDAGAPYCKNTQVRGTESWRSRANAVTNGEAGERPRNVHTAICVDGKCSCCGSYIIADPKTCGLDPPSYEFPDVGLVPQGRKPYTPNRHELPVDTAMGVRTNLNAEAPDVGSLPLRVIPCWVLPSQHRIRIEPIKETYIGEVTSIDGVSVIEAGDTDASFQDNSAKMKDTTGAKDSAHCDAMVSGSNGRTADSIELHAKGIDQPRRCIGENSLVIEPVSTAADCKSKSRRKTVERRRHCVQLIQCQREDPESNGQESRGPADSKPVVSASVSWDHHITGQSTERVTELSPVSEQQPTPLPPVSTSDQSSKQMRESSTFQGPSLPQQKGTRSLGSGQLKDTPSSSRAQNRSGTPASHPTLPPKFMEKTFTQHPLPRSLMIRKCNLKSPSNSQPCAVPPILKFNPLTHLGTCPSPQYRLIHLEPQESDGSLSDSHAFLETSSLPPQRGPGGPDQQPPNGRARTSHAPGPAAHGPLSSALRLPRNTLTNGGSQSSESHGSEVGRSSQAANQLTDPNGGLLPPEHHEPIVPTNGNCPTCPTSPSPEAVSSSEQSGLWLVSKHSAEKQSDKIETRPETVKKRPQDNTSSREQPAPIAASAPGEHWDSARPPQTGPKDSEQLLPTSCGERPTYLPESGPAEGDRGPACPRWPS